MLIPVTRVAHNRAAVHAAVHEADRVEVHGEDHEAVHEVDREAAREVDQEDPVDVALDVGAVALVGKMPDSRAALVLPEDPAVVLEAGPPCPGGGPPCPGGGPPGPGNIPDQYLRVACDNAVWQAFEKVLFTDVLVSVIHSINYILLL